MAVASGIEAWYMDSSEEDQRAPHKMEPNVPVSKEILSSLGVLQWKLCGGDAAEVCRAFLTLIANFFHTLWPYKHTRDFCVNGWNIFVNPIIINSSRKMQSTRKSERRGATLTPTRLPLERTPFLIVMLFFSFCIRSSIFFAEWFDFFSLRCVSNIIMWPSRWREDQNVLSRAFAHWRGDQIHCWRKWILRCSR